MYHWLEANVYVTAVVRVSGKIQLRTLYSSCFAHSLVDMKLNNQIMKIVLYCIIKIVFDLCTLCLIADAFDTGTLWHEGTEISHAFQ